MEAANKFAITKLNDMNYITWKYRMTVILKAEGLYSALETAEPPAEQQEAHNGWIVKNDKAMSYITCALEDSQLAQIITLTTAKAIWEKLAKMHASNIDIKKMDIWREVAKLRMKDDELWIDYITRGRALCEKARSLGLAITEREEALNISKGLSRKYRSVDMIFNATENINIDLLKRTLAAQDEKDEDDNQRKLADSVYRVKYQSKKKYNPAKCWICNKPGHKQKDCWFKDDKRNTPEAQKNSRSVNNTENRGKTWQKRRPPEVRNATNNSTSQNEAWNVRANNSTLTDWLLDSGATAHMSPNTTLFTDYEEKEEQVKMADESVAKTQGKGAIYLQGSKRNIMLTNVLHVPNLRGNLVSVSKITRANNTVVFDSNGATVLNQDGQVVATAKLKDDLYILNTNVQNQEYCDANVAKVAKQSIDQKAQTTIRESSTTTSLKESTAYAKESKMLWHKRIGHLNEKGLDQLKKKQMLHGLDYKDEKMPPCAACIKGKMVRNPFPTIGKYQSTKPLELLHLDLCGPFQTESLSGKRYILTIVDDYSRKVFTFFLTHKNEATQKLENFKRGEEARTENQIKRIRSDNGREFVCEEMKQLLDKSGIQHQTTIPYSPQSNGIAERENRTLIDTVRTMLIDAELPLSFWAEATATASYIRNSCPTKINVNETPEERYSGKKPTARHFKTFGCLAYYWLPKQRRKKLLPKAKEGIFVGYSRMHAAYRIYDPELKRSVETRDVKFTENEKGSKLLNKEEIYENNEQFEYIPLNDHPEMINQETREDQTLQGNELNVPQPLRRSQRIQERNQQFGIPFYHEESETDSDEEDTQEMVNRVTSLSVTQTKEIVTPKTYEDAITSLQKEKWQEAMQEEITSLTLHNTWKIVKRPKQKKVIKSKWVYRLKKYPDGSVQKFKARLVGVGCSQDPGKDYNETYSPVIRLESLRTLIAVAKMKNYHMKCCDVKTAYLYGKLEEDILMEQPTGFELENPNTHVCKLLQGIYGLKQSGRIWYKTFVEYLEQIGFKKSAFDQCVFIFKDKLNIVYLALYVDDIMIFGTSQKVIDTTIKKIQENFELTETNNDSMLGWEINWNDQKVTLSQQSYAKEILTKFGLVNCKPSKTPLEPNQNLEVYENSPRANSTLYQEILGSLMYLVSGTRPDLACAVTVLSQYIKDPRQIHLNAARHVLKYVKGTVNHQLHYTNKPGLLTGFADASWNDGNGNQKSLSGYVIKLGENVVAWKSKKQLHVSTSTCQSELTAIYDCIKELKWIRGFIAELDAMDYLPTTISVFNDNQAAIQVSDGIAMINKVRHFIRLVMYVKDEVLSGNCKLLYQPGTELCADIFTKPVSNSKLQKALKFIGVY